MRFDELGLDPDILRSLEAMNFHEMTPVQEATIPIILNDNDLIGCAQTGTGKTAAYTLPLLDKFIRKPNSDNVVRSLIVVPTRELAMQIDVQFQGFSYFLPLSTTVVYGGGDGIGWEQQKQGMLRGSDIVVATPGRLLAHLANSGIDLSHVEYFVLDEADRMLDMGFHDDIMKIIKALPEKRQTLLFSATLPPKIRELAKQILHNPTEINIAVSKPNEAIEQGAYICYETQKLDLIRELFSNPLDSKTIIFASSKQKVKELTFILKRMKLNAAAMHSDLEQEQREEVIFAFKNGKNGDILVQKAPACTIEVLAKALIELIGIETQIKVIGIRHGEKLYETLLTNEECSNAIDMGNFYRVPMDSRSLNYDKYFKDGDIERNSLREFNSNNTELLNVDSVKEKLLKIDYIKESLNAFGGNIK